MAEELIATGPATSTDTDWNAVRERYLAGEELASIAADHNTTAKAIAQKAWLCKWRALQFKALEDQKEQTEREVRGCLMVSVLKEARCYQREDPPSEPKARMDYGKARMLCYETAAKLFGWCDDPVAKAKPAKCLDV